MKERHCVLCEKEEGGGGVGGLLYNKCAISPAFNITLMVKFTSSEAILSSMSL